MIRAAFGHKPILVPAQKGQKMSYVEKSLVPGERLLYQTRHHWIILLGPGLLGAVCGLLAVALLVEAAAAKASKGVLAGASSKGVEAVTVFGVFLLVVAIVAIAYGVAKRNATEMAVTNRRVLIKTGMASRRTLDLMLSRVESIGVEETVVGRVLGYGSVIVRGTGGTPEPFLMIAHPQEFRRAVQERTGQDPGQQGATWQRLGDG
jgi:uncharacterized membrane protein YdbT with pleckstrin-like domain